MGTIKSLVHKIRLHGRRGKGMAESFSREKLRHAPQKEGGWKILCDLPPVWPRLVRPTNLMSRMNDKKTHTNTIQWYNYHLFLFVCWHVSPHGFKLINTPPVGDHHRRQERPSVETDTWHPSRIDGRLTAIDRPLPSGRFSFPSRLAVNATQRWNPMQARGRHTCGFQRNETRNEMSTDTLVDKLLIFHSSKKRY